MTVLILSRQREFKLLKLVLLLAGLHKVQPCRYCFYSVVSSPKIGFSPRRVTHCPDKREIWHAHHVKFGTMCVPNFTFIGAEMWEYSPKTVKISKFRILTINLPLRGHSFAQFLRNSQILYTFIGSF